MKKEKGFTLAEVVITMIIIGVITALTMPMLHNNASDKKWNVARQKAQSTIGEAFKLMTVSGEITDKLTTTEFAEKIIPKYLKVEKLCGTGAEGAAKCGFKMKNNKPTVRMPDGKEKELPMSFSTSTFAWSSPSYSTNNPTTKNYNNSYFFRTLDGFSINFFYNPYCAVNKKDKSHETSENGYVQQFALDVVCFNVVYDMNGKQGPNQVGKDIGFLGSFYNGFETTSASVLPHNKDIATKDVGTGDNHWLRASKYCENIEPKGDWILPDINELSLIYLNRYLITNDNSEWFRSRTPYANVHLSVLFATKFTGVGIRGDNIVDTETNRLFRCVRSIVLK